MTFIQNFNSFQDFNKLSDSEISKIIETRLKDCNTMVYAYDGTRRSYLIDNIKTNESSTINDENNINNGNKNKTTMINYDEYCKTAITKLLYDLVMMFQHGIKTIVYPMWFCTLEDRGPDYLPKFIKYLSGLNSLIENEELVQLYKENGIRVIFYGEYIKLLERGNDKLLLSKFQTIMEQTKNNTKHTILFGTTIEEPSQTIIDNSIEFYKKFNYKPTKNELIKQYYGLNVDQCSFYIGFDRFSTDGRPIYLSDKGNEDLYYTISPHSFFSKNNFRKVLYDKLYCRSSTNAKEYKLKVIDIEMMKHFYDTNSNNIMGIGNVNPYGNYWYPSPQVQLPITSTNFSQTINTFKKLELNSNNNNNNNNSDNGASTATTTSTAIKVSKKNFYPTFQKQQVA